MPNPTQNTQLKVEGKFYTFLAEGAQSSVYKHGNEILKLPHLPDKLYQLAKEHAVLFGRPASIEEAQSVYQYWIKLIQEAREHLSSGRMPANLFADLRIDDQHRMFQKEIIIFGDSFDSKKFKDEPFIKGLIDKFADIHILLWSNGICETECSLFTNYGSDPKTGQLLVPDFGSISFNFQEAIRSVGKPISLQEAEEYMSRTDLTPEPHFPDWFAKGQVRESLRAYPDLLTYYIEKMSSVLTPVKLEFLWPAHLKET